MNMTVKELIKQLSEMDPTLEVVTPSADTDPAGASYNKGLIIRTDIICSACGEAFSNFFTEEKVGEPCGRVWENKDYKKLCKGAKTLVVVIE